MMPDMLERVDSYLEDAGLYNGWVRQLEMWNDSTDGAARVIVLQSSGGTQVRQGLGNDYYFSLYIVGQQGQYDIEAAKAKALEITSYIKDNPLDSCLNYIQIQTPMQRPFLTEEKRVVYEILLRVVWGD